MGARARFMIGRTGMKYLLLACGFLSLALGIAGIFLPVVPTVPFLIVSAYCFSKSSPRLHAWLYRQKTIGKLWRDWDRERSIPLRAKILSTVMLIGSILLSDLYLELSAPIIISMSAIFAAVLIYIWTRALPSSERA